MNGIAGLQTNNDVISLIIKVKAGETYTRLALVGDALELGSWNLSRSLQLSIVPGNGKFFSIIFHPFNARSYAAGTF